MKQVYGNKQSGAGNKTSPNDASNHIYY
jgi:hypothetical protein